MDVDLKAPKHGLPAWFWVPIAADCVSSIGRYVGLILDTIGPSVTPNAVLVQTHRPPRCKAPAGPGGSSVAFRFQERLFPDRQVWVRVDYNQYREAYVRFAMPPIPAGYVLDHVQNREAMRLRNYSHPYLRLCPVSKRVNTQGGVNAGGEGMEKAYLREVPGVLERLSTSHVIYADPMDITKMLDVLPGTQELPGVRAIQQILFRQ